MQREVEERRAREEAAAAALAARLKAEDEARCVHSILLGLTVCMHFRDNANIRFRKAVVEVFAVSLAGSQEVGCV